MEAAHEPGFEADVQVGTRFRFIDRNGSAVIAGGRLTLRKRDGDVIADAPIGEVWADRMKASGDGAARIWIGGDRHTIEPLRVRRANPEALAGEVANLARDFERLQKGRELAERFLAVVEVQGGHIGKP
jgi:hypothetical protein